MRKAGALCDLYEDSVGLRWYLQTCPWALLQSPVIREISVAHKWFLQSQFSTRFPDAPVILLNALTDFDNGYNRGKYDQIEADRKKREAEQAAAAARAGRGR